MSTRYRIPPIGSSIQKLINRKTIAAPIADTGDDDGEGGDDLGDLISPLPGNRSNRVKYRCPSCGAQAWGKPSLRLLCGNEDCKAVPLDPVE